MQHWDRNITGRLERTSASQEQGFEVSLHNNQMEPPPEEQQSQQGIPRNPNAYMSMRDHIHPSRVWKMRIHTHTSGSLRKFALLLWRVQSIWICLS